MNHRRVVIAGAGPTGLYLAIALARRNHQVIVVDRDRGPAPDGSWGRKGVMQFHHPHGFRGQVVDALIAEMPEVLRRDDHGRRRARDDAGLAGTHRGLEKPT